MPNKPGAGRPRTKDGRRGNVYLSNAAWNYLKRFKNQSEVIDNLVREKIKMVQSEGKQNWTAHLSLEGLTQDQVNALTLKIVEWVEAEGGFVGGGFALEADDEKEPGTDQNQ
jgi:hypothetical protein